ncbi:MAG: hypothetical protein E6Q24_05115 [Chitinophagaceae bacterium]|nr:MAG: hypothetical protein E6Q24_05115 [Chitinophagaceae bacterium]
MKTPPVQAVQQNLFELPPAHCTSKAKGQRKEKDNFAFDIMDALTAPILTFSQQWADTMPKRLLGIIPLARLKMLLMKEEKASYEECVLYIYTRSLEAPMNTDWVDIYTHVSCKVLGDWFNENHWQETKAPKQLNEWLQSKLTGLQQHIYSKRRELLKQKIRQEKRGCSTGDRAKKQ